MDAGMRKTVTKPNSTSHIEGNFIFYSVIRSNSSKSLSVHRCAFKPTDDYKLSGTITDCFGRYYSDAKLDEGRQLQVDTFVDQTELFS